MVILRYFKLLFSLWTTLVFTAVDIAAFVFSSTSQSISFNPWVYWLVAGVGFITANVQLFYQHEKTIEMLESKDGISILEVFSAGITPYMISGEKHMLSPKGLPVHCGFFMELRLNNNSPETGEFQFRINNKKSKLPYPFAYKENTDNNQLISRVERFPGDQGTLLHLKVPVYMLESVPERFASLLYELPDGEVCFDYWTKYPARMSRRQTIKFEFTISQSFHKTMIRYWINGGFDNLAEIASPRD